MHHCEMVTTTFRCDHSFASPCPRFSKGCEMREHKEQQDFHLRWRTLWCWWWEAKQSLIDGHPAAIYNTLSIILKDPSIQPTCAAPTSPNHRNLQGSDAVLRVTAFHLDHRRASVDMEWNEYVTSFLSLLQYIDNKAECLHSRYSTKVWGRR